ncbi:hypothetical protein CDAR_437621 [Caerostris darwini]|uniref:Uncharacterized protein n=1 Tax=Caerostris darwini TaxID=1538125 RepID=A0AAV4NY06_9ARAC|nr:hypothetical protein CDAR_437621 [Caerostris darwini]
MAGRSQFQKRRRFNYTAQPAPAGPTHWKVSAKGFDEWAIIGVDVSKSEEHNPQFAPRLDGLTTYFAYCRLSLPLTITNGPRERGGRTGGLSSEYTSSKRI